MPAPDIIFLNGTSSSGKTTLSKALQYQMEAVYLHVALDAFAIMFPLSKLGDQDLCASAEPKLREGFYRSVAALVGCGNKVIVDTVAHEPCAQRFKPLFMFFNVVYVAVKCPAEELQRREKARGDRSIGLALSQLPEMHSFLHYDVEVDTHEHNAEECAALIKQFIASSSCSNDALGAADAIVSDSRSLDRGAGRSL